MYPLIRFPTRNDQTSSVFPTKNAGFSPRKRLISSQIWSDFLYVAASDPGSPEAIDQNEEPPGHQGAPDRDESGDTAGSWWSWFMITSDNSSIKVTVFFIHSRIERTNMMNTEKSQLMGRELHYRGSIYIYIPPCIYIYIYLSLPLNPKFFPFNPQISPRLQGTQWVAQSSSFAWAMEATLLCWRPVGRHSLSCGAIGARKTHIPSGKLT